MEKNLPLVLTKQQFLLSRFKTSGRFFQILVPFSEKLNFNRNGVCRYVPVGYVGQPIILVTLKVILPETIGTIP